MQTSSALARIFEQAPEFFMKLDSRLDKLGLDLRAYAPDHACYRVATLTEYESVKLELARETELLAETPVNGRPICTFRLQMPLRYGSHEIWLLELPAPKAGSAYQTGFEHVEFVIDCSFEEFEDRHSVLKGRTKFSAKQINSELALSFGDCAVKFHHQSLEDVIELEKKLGLA